LSENPKEKARFGDLEVDGRIILKRILENGVLRGGLDWTGSGSDPVADFCELSNECFESHEKKNFLTN
jgi:hypothetical protein